MKARDIAIQNGFDWNELSSFIEKKSGLKYKTGIMDTSIADEDVPRLIEMFNEQREEDVHNNSNNVISQVPYYLAALSVRGLPYEVVQVTLKEELAGSGSKNLSELEEVLNYYAENGYRLHTMATSSAKSSGVLGGDRIQATLVFEKKDF